ncbi:unnamed protein product [Bursaphelenchus okinawaensis]|uniref:Uncharacterized protein n=1 Tax=Bursaphelenchus okinawaensis TaxID=465554 RepID=A0A811KQ20_9BILA|nr:unnamed protein product [Bursaphelenchus okinawaensis]CAG9108434.1 unnamed protein product [Bursaphelenchus okinawaensis]
MAKVSPTQGMVEKKPTLKNTALKVKHARRISGLSQDLQYNKACEAIEVPDSEIKKLKKESKIKWLIRILTTNPPAKEDKTLKEMAAKMKPVEKARDFCPLHCFQKTKEHSIHNKVRLRHLELEPLCCLSSCVIASWMVYIFFKGVIRFDRLYVKLHWQFDFFALGYNSMTFLVLATQYYNSTELDNVLVVACMGLQIPVQIWAIAIVKECFQFFNLLYVLIMIAEP